MTIPAHFTAAVADRYRIEREIGQGGMATVYLAHDLRHDTQLRERGDHARFSPDGRWLAHLQGAGVAVSPVPPSGETHRVSTGFGEMQMWSLAGDVLYYRFGRRIWAVDVETEGGFRTGAPRLAAEGRFVRVFGRSYDVAPDGRLLVVPGSPESSADRIHVNTGFHERLRRLAPVN